MGKSVDKAKTSVADVTSKSDQFAATEVTGSLQPLLKPLADQTWRILRHTRERSEVPLTTDEMISEIAGEVDGFVKEAFKDIERQIAAMHEQVVALATKVSTLKPTADKKDSELYACRKQEKALLLADNDVEAAMAALTEENDRVCKQRDLAKYFNWTVRTDLDRGGLCDFKGQECGYRMVSANVRNLTEEYRTARANYFQLQEECTIAMNTLDRQLAEDTVSVGSTTAFQRKKESCDVIETVASTAMCTFGNRLQEKCYAVSQLQELVALLQPDSVLQSLYFAAQELKCALEVMKARNDGFADFVNPCVSHPPDFHRDVGQFKDFKPITEKYTAGPYYACEDAPIQFGGKRMNGGKSVESYYEIDYSPEVTIAPMGQYSFDFCRPFYSMTTTTITTTTVSTTTPTDVYQAAIANNLSLGLPVITTTMMPGFP